MKKSNLKAKWKNKKPNIPR